MGNRSLDENLARRHARVRRARRHLWRMRRDGDAGRSVAFLLDSARLRKVSVTRWSAAFRGGPYAGGPKTVVCPYSRLYLFDSGRCARVELDAAAPAPIPGAHERLLGFYEPAIAQASLCFVWREQGTA